MSVGYGGYPDRDGHVTLDACIMDSNGNAGSVAFLEGIKHPVSVVRLVMEKTAHVLLVGEGAKKFALGEKVMKTVGNFWLWSSCAGDAIPVRPAWGGAATYSPPVS